MNAILAVVGAKYLRKRIGLHLIASHLKVRHTLLDKEEKQPQTVSMWPASYGNISRGKRFLEMILKKGLCLVRGQL